MRGVTSLAVVMCALVVPAIARADGVAITAHVLDADGWPLLIANYGPDGTVATASWQVCAPDCGPVVATNAVYAAGPTALGTTFVASTTVGGVTTSARSPAWGGQLTNSQPPTFDGAPRVGQTLMPHAGSWAGGWGDEFSLLGMRACPTRAGLDCRAMTASILQGGNPSSVTIDPAYEGWYVGAIERRVGQGTATAPVGFLLPPGRVSALRAPVPGQTVAAGPLSGPVLAAADTLSDRLRVTPRVRIRKHALRRGGTLVLATISCPARCVAHATMRHGRTTLTRRIVVTDGRASVRLLPGTFPPHATIVRVNVRFDNHPRTARGTVKLR